ncbi:fructose-6-phosphate aldolase [candidate division LCP-89 bacterium B3_LCP]|uniref:Probable transaldolase n=1 Tax=candidate division LCP-89 bacterium B3_LCP TaxID=2012998 RepID=A0A532UZ91_UNCL8|nr:MAG: fructose-6-phosphate aldolase [candidate division LCP-89 bacterium B3_LCP]
MKFFIDTANVDEIKQAASIGVLDGVTTNPTLVARENRKFEDLIKEICGIVDGPISAEVISLEYDGMVKEAKKLAQIHKNITIKLPMTLEGLKACRTLTDADIMTNMTLVFSPSQALLAAKAGATFVSPFVGRLDDISTSGMDLIDQIVTIYENYGYTSEVLVASVRHPLHVVEAAMMGADVVTMPFKVIEKLVKHPLTDKGIDSFLKDWKKVKDLK